MEIFLEFDNFKGVDVDSLELSGSYIYLIAGSNNKGKTSVVQAIESLLTAKMNVDEPVTRGKKKGSIHGLLPAADGKMYDVYCDYTNEKATFYAVGDDGEKITKVNQIRELFNYSHINVSDFLSWSLTAEGIRKQVKIILSLLPQAEQDTYQMLTDEEAVTFELRKDKKKEYDLLLKRVTELSDAERVLLSNEGKAIERIQALDKQLEELYFQNSKLLKLRERLEKFTLAREVCDLEDKRQETLETDLSIIIGDINRSISLLPKDSDAEIDKIKTARDTGNAYLSSINVVKEKARNIEEQKLSILKVKKELDKANDDLEEIRAKKKQILSEGKLPFDNIEITDEGLTIDGFAFKDSQVCRSAAIKAVAKMMCKMNPSPIILLGQASELDRNSLGELYDLAEETNHILVFDKVLEEETPLCVIGIDKTK